MPWRTPWCQHRRPGRQSRPRVSDAQWVLYKDMTTIKDDHFHLMLAAFVGLAIDDGKWRAAEGVGVRAG